MGPLRLATKAAGCLADVPDIDAVVLFGSVARGDGSLGSDIDVLVVSGGDAELTAAAVRADLPRRLRDPRLAVTCVPLRRLRGMWRRGDVLAHHLAAEGRVLFDRDGTVSTLLASTPPRSGDMNARVARVRAQLSAFEDLSIYRGQLLFALSSLYALAKGIVLADQISVRDAQFQGRAAFEAFGARHPDLAEDVRTLMALEPYYATVTRRRAASSLGVESDLESVARGVLAAIQHVCTYFQGEGSTAEGSE